MEAVFPLRMAIGVGGSSTLRTDIIGFGGFLVITFPLGLGNHLIDIIVAAAIEGGKK